MKAAVLAGFDFVAHINLAGWVVTNQYNCQARRNSLDFQSHGAACDVCAQLLGEGVAVNFLGCHGVMVLNIKISRL